jgi:inosose dehydratase
VNIIERVACAPISWGVIEVPDWGYQMPPETVLREAAELGVKATEAGPEGFLPRDPEELREKLSQYGLEIIGGFDAIVLHDPSLRKEQLAAFERRADFFASAGGTTMVVAAATGSVGYEEVVDLGDGQWGELFNNLARAEEIARERGLEVSLHSHYGTVIETDEQLWRFLEGCRTGLCLDTGHLLIGGSDPVEVAKRAGERVNHVHLKDVDANLARRMASREIGFKEAAIAGVFKPLGEGNIDVGEVIRLLEHSEYDGWYVLEQDCVLESRPEGSEGPVNEVRKSLEFLRQQTGS